MEIFTGREQWGDPYKLNSLGGTDRWGAMRPTVDRLLVICRIHRALRSPRAVNTADETLLTRNSCGEATAVNSGSAADRFYIVSLVGEMNRNLISVV